ncbi:MAG: presqualene diphosphate synthase HpnD, partial [bacterium]
IRAHSLPLQPFRDLIAAFRQDVTIARYPDYSDLLDYCRLSANPVGRIMLMLHGVRDEEAFHASDAICSALQIANHLQDVKEDYLRGRVYLPQAELEAFGVKEEELAGETAGPALRALMVFQVRRTRDLFAVGLPLLERTRGALGRELRAIFRGGLAALDSVERADHDVLTGSPRLNLRDKAACALAAFLPAGRLGNRIGAQANARADSSYCRWYLRSSRSSFYLAFLSLPPARRRALSAIYGYCRIVDDIADTPGDAEEKRRQLETWREAIAHLADQEHRHPILRELASAVEAYGVSTDDLLDVCRGVEMDLDQNRYRTFDELREYCHKVASAVGLSCLRVFGENTPAGIEYGRTLGLALQLTNILRDLWADAEDGRIYLPLDDLSRFGVTEESILEGERSEALVELLRFEAARAQELFEEANSLLPERSHWRLFPARFMGRVYRRVLGNMVAADFPAPGWKPSLSKWAKLREAFLCLLGM